MSENKAYLFVCYILNELRSCVFKQKYKKMILLKIIMIYFANANSGYMIRCCGKAVNIKEYVDHHCFTIVIN